MIDHQSTCVRLVICMGRSMGFSPEAGIPQVVIVTIRCWGVESFELGPHFLNLFGIWNYAGCSSCILWGGLSKLEVFLVDGNVCYNTANANGANTLLKTRMDMELQNIFLMVCGWKIRTSWNASVAGFERIEKQGKNNWRGYSQKQGMLPFLRVCIYIYISLSVCMCVHLHIYIQYNKPRVRKLEICKGRLAPWLYTKL